VIQQVQDKGGSSPYARSLSRACAALLLLLCACRAPAAETGIPRTLGGQPRVGQFVPPFAYEAYVRGELALSRGDANAAIRAFELAAAAPDEDAYVLSRLAWAQSLGGDAKGAKQSLERAAQIDPCSEAVWTTRAKLAEREQDLPRARDAYAEAAHCAPRSALGPLGLARMLTALGERERAQTVLQTFAARVDRPASYEAALELALSRGDAIAVAAALDGLSAVSTPALDTLSHAIEQALAMDRPWLAARLAEHTKPAIPPALAARVCLACGDVACAQAKLAMATTEALGGSVQAAELLVAAELHERAEVEASVALTSLPSPRLFLARARARAALGDTEGALADLAEVEPSPATQALLVELTKRAGLTGMADELNAQPTAPSERRGQSGSAQ